MMRNARRLAWLVVKKKCRSVRWVSRTTCQYITEKKRAYFQVRYGMSKKISTQPRSSISNSSFPLSYGMKNANNKWDIALLNEF